MKDRQWKWSEYYKRSNQSNCGKKRSFNSFAEASGFNKRAVRYLSGNKRRERLHVYRCNICRQWHIGHPPTKQGHFS